MSGISCCNGARHVVFCVARFLERLCIIAYRRVFSLSTNNEFLEYKNFTSISVTHDKLEIQNSQL